MTIISGSGIGGISIGDFAGGAALGAAAGAVGMAAQGMQMPGQAAKAVGGALKAAAGGVAGGTGIAKAIGAAFESAKQETKENGSYGANSGSPLMRAMGLTGATIDKLVNHAGSSAGSAAYKAFNDKVDSSSGGKLANTIESANKTK